MTITKDTPRLIRHYTSGLKKILDARTQIPEIPIRLQDVNKIAWGIHKQKLTIVGARTGNCKSAFALNLGFDAALSGHKTIFISLEMSPSDIIERLFIYNQLINNKDLLTGKFPRYQNQWNIFLERIASVNFMISDLIGRTTLEVTELLDGLAQKPDIVIIDHLQEIRSSERDKKKTIDEYLDFMRALAIQYNFALIICSQVNRLSQEEKDKAPQLHHLKQSGAIEEKADMVYLLHWPYKYGHKDINHFEVNLAKNRNGMTGHIKLRYFPEVYMFFDKDGDGPYHGKPQIEDPNAAN